MGENSEIEFWKKIPEFGKYELPRVERHRWYVSLSTKIAIWIYNLEMMEDQIKCKQRIGYEVLDIKPGILMNPAVL